MRTQSVRRCSCQCNDDCVVSSCRPPGFTLNNTIYQQLVARYSDPDMTIDFDNFVGCLMRLEMMFSESFWWLMQKKTIFKKHSTNKLWGRCYPQLHRCISVWNIQSQSWNKCTNSGCVMFFRGTVESRPLSYYLGTETVNFLSPVSVFKEKNTTVHLLTRASLFHATKMSLTA